MQAHDIAVLTAGEKKRSGYLEKKGRAGKKGFFGISHFKNHPYAPNERPDTFSRRFSPCARVYSKGPRGLDKKGWILYVKSLNILYVYV